MLHKKGVMSIQKCLLDNSSRMIKAMSTAKSSTSEVKMVCSVVDPAVRRPCGSKADFFRLLSKKTLVIRKFLYRTVSLLNT